MEHVAVYEDVRQEPHRSHLTEVLDVMVQRLGAVVPNLGENLAADAAGLKAQRKEAEGAKEE